MEGSTVDARRAVRRTRIPIALRARSRRRISANVAAKSTHNPHPSRLDPDSINSLLPNSTLINNSSSKTPSAHPRKPQPQLSTPHHKISGTNYRTIPPPTSSPTLPLSRMLCMTSRRSRSRLISSRPSRRRGSSLDLERITRRCYGVRKRVHRLWRHSPYLRRRRRRPGSHSLREVCRQVRVR